MRARILIPFLLGLVAVKLALDHVADVDLFWHLRLGLDALEKGGLATTVDYAWTVPGAPYLANDWLAQVVLGFAFELGGLAAVGVLKALLAGAVVLLVYFAALSRAEGHAPAAGLAAAVMLFVAAANFIARPLLFGQLALALEILLLERAFRGGRWAPWAMPLVFGFWINSHGSWPAGFGPLAVAAAAVLLPWKRGRLATRPVLEAARRPVLLACGLGPLGLLLNPLGTAMLLRPFRLMGKQAEMAIIDEWAPVPWNDPSAWILVGAALLVVFASLRSRRPLPSWDLGLIGLTFAMALSASRHLSIFALIAAPPLAELLAGRMQPKMFRREGSNAVVAAVAGLALGAIGLSRLATVGDEARALLPIAAVERLHQSGLAQRRGFHYFEWGGYLVFEKIPSFIDGRLEPFLAIDLFSEYVRIEREGDAEAIEGREICWALLKPGTPLAGALAGRAGWEKGFEDEGSVLWLREGCGR